MDMLEDYLPVAQNGYDGIIAITDIKVFLDTTRAEGFEV